MMFPFLTTKLCSLVVIVGFLSLRQVKAANDADRVLGLPHLDQDDVCWAHYAGYLPATNGHELFYWYHEAVTDPGTKPLVLWLNGGPGCSSLGGMFTELGPFVLDAQLQVTINPFSFNKHANILFIEQPAGVGFSHPNVPANDTSTAVDTVAALRHFLQTKHPELQPRDFYVMGESYGGHYVPNTVKQIQDTNAYLPAYQQINIRGFAVGNGYTDWQLDFNANVANGRYHALTSQALYEKAEKACDGDFARCFWPRPDIKCPWDCGAAVHEATKHAEGGAIDIYDVYDDVCLQPGQARRETQLTKFMGHRRQAILKHTMLGGRDSDLATQRKLRATISPVYPTCIDVFTETYLNLPEVQAAIHVKPETIPGGRWKDCGDVEYDFNYESELPNYRKWVQEGKLQILIYNGDTDFILSHMGNSAWINQGLQLDKTQEWTMWRGSDGQVAGYFERYATGDGDGSSTSQVPLTYLTVKGAGHMVPRDRPRHALDMFEKFITGGTYDQVKRKSDEPLCSGTLKIDGRLAKS